MAVDDQNVYWAQQGGNLRGAPKEGGGAATLLGSWGSTLAGMVIRAANEHVYWIDGGSLSRVPRSGGEAQRTTLPWTTGEGLAVDDTYVYVAMAGCAAVVRVHQKTLALEWLTVDTPLEERTGHTYVVHSGDTLYCGAWQRLYAIRDWDRLEELTAVAEQIAGIAVLQDKLYWLDRKTNLDGTPRGEMWALDSNGSAQKSGESLVSRLPPYDIFPDDERSRLIWVNINVAEYSAESTVTRVLTHGSFGTGCARDETYLYWGRTAPGGDDAFGTIERARLDELGAP